jgi:hypothetical protein
MTDDADGSDPSPHDGGRSPADDESADADAPLSDIAARRRARREEREADADDPFSTLDRETDAEPTDGAPPAESDDAFEEMDVDPVDSEDVWVDLLDADDDATAAAGDSTGTEPGQAAATDATPGAGSAAAEAETDAREEHVIPKADYCQQCAYFADPPEVACENEGTDIVSVEDFEHFRVRGCPVVENEFDPSDGNY